MGYSKTNTKPVNWRLHSTLTTTKGSPGPRVVRQSTTGSVNESVSFGNNIPGWRDAISNGRSATTSLNGTKWEFSSSSLSAEYEAEVTADTSVDQGDYQKYTLDGQVGAGLSIGIAAPTLSPRANNYAITNFFKHARAAQRSLMGFVVLGEMAEVVHMIRHPAEAFYKGLLKYLGAVGKRAGRRKLSRRTKAVNEAIAGTWLEHSFGWAPLINDIEGGIQAYAKLAIAKPPYEVVTGKGKDRVSATNFDANMSYGPISLKRKVRDSGTCEVKYVGRVNSANIPLVDTATILGFTIQDFVPSIWELIPYSFLIDYFANVGEVLEALTFNTATLGWVYRGTHSDLKREVINAHVEFPASLPGWEILSRTSSVGGGASISQSIVSREDWGSKYMLPDFILKVPGVGSLKWLNCAALLSASKATSQAISRLG